jgi:hypothetical protein
MSPPSDFNKTVEQFITMHQKVAGEDGIGDPSLDMLLVTSEPPLSQLIKDLSVPHWFDEHMVSLLTTQSGGEIGPTWEEVLSLPFTRSHPQGYAYHDRVRYELRTFLGRKEPKRVKEISQLLDDYFAHVPPPPLEEIKWERVYLGLAFDEPRSLKELFGLIKESRQNRRFNVFDTLVHMAEEQQPFLSHLGTCWIRFYEGILAFDSHRLEQADTTFTELERNDLPLDLYGRVSYFMGLTKEALGLWKCAERIYSEAIERLSQGGASPAVISVFFHRLSETFLFQGDLDRAEKLAKKCLNLRCQSGDQEGEAVCLETLGRVYEKLQDFDRAKEAFQNSLDILRNLGREFDQAKVHSALANLYFSFSRWEEAEKHYQIAQQIKVDAGDNYGLAGIYSNMGKLRLIKGDQAGALRYFQSGLEIFQDFGDRQNAAKLLRNIAVTYEHFQDLQSALGYMQKAHQEALENSPLKEIYFAETLRLKKVLEKARIKE